MKIYIKNLYGLKDGRKAYYRKQGTYCFDFAWSKDYASDLSDQEVKNVLEHGDWYMQQYNADEIGVEE